MNSHVRKFFDFAIDMFVVIDSQGHYVEINPAWTKNLGWTLAEMKDLSFRQFVHPSDISKTEEKAVAIWSQPGEMFEFENRYRHKDGGYRWIYWTGYMDPTENVSYCVARDITDHKTAHRILKSTQKIQEEFLYHYENTAKIKSLILSNLADLFESPAGYLILQNENQDVIATEVLGLGSNVTCDLPAATLDTLPILRPIENSVFEKYFSNSSSFPLVMCVPLTRGQEGYGVVALVVRDEAQARCMLKRAEPLFKAIVDGLAVTRLKHREKELHNNLLRASLLAEQTQEVARIGGWELDFASGQFFWTKETYRLHNLDCHLPPPSYPDILEYGVPESRSRIRNLFQRLRQTGEGFDIEFEIEIPQFRRFWVRLLGRAIYEDGVVTKAYGSFQDINEKKSFEDQFKTLIENLPAAVYRCKKDMSVTFISNVIEEISGRRPKDFFNQRIRSFNELIHQEDLPMVQKFRLASCRLKEPYLLRYRLIHSDGTIHWVYERGRGTLTHDGEVDYFDGAIFDITDLMDAKARAQETDNRMRLALSAVRMGVWEWDIPKNRIRWDQGIYEIYEIDPQTKEDPAEIYQRHIHPDDMERVVAEFKGVLNKRTVLHTAFRIVVPRGEIKVIGSRGRAEYDSDGTPIRMTGVNWDMTIEHVQAETIRQQQMQMVQSAKMASLGEMASGIAHEINNPLAIIQGKAAHLKSLISAEQLSGPKLATELDKIELTSKRISKIIKGLRSFSRNAAKDPFSLVQFPTIVDDTLELCRERFKSALIEIRTQLEYRESIYCRSAQIGQVLLNLLNNSYDAVLGQENAWVEIRCRESRSGVQISIVDSGPGISTEISEKIMEPFFTTKAVGKGTGLGLSISKGIVEEHQGQLWLDKNSENTCFMIEIPKHFRSIQGRRILDSGQRLNC